MPLRLPSLLLSLIFLMLATGLAEGAERDARQGPATDASTTFGCPSMFKTLRLLTGDGNVGKVRQLAGQPSYAFLCRYVGDAGTAEWDARWDEKESTSPTKCGVTDERGTTAPGVPYAYVYSQTRAAYLYVGGRGATVDEMIAAGRSHLQEAEGKAMACTQATPTMPKCPPRFNALPFNDRFPNNGVVHDLGSGGWNLFCQYAMNDVGNVHYQVIWFQKVDAATHNSTCGKGTQGTGLQQSYLEYSRTKEAYITLSIGPGAGRNVNVYPATADEVKAAARTLLVAAEALAVPCFTRSSGGAAPPPAAGAAPAAQPTPETRPVAGAGPDANVLPDDAYQEPGTVSDDGIAARVLEPGSELPGSEEAAAAAGVLVAGAAAVGVSELARNRRRQNPVANIGGGILQREATAILDEEARRILRRSLPKGLRSGIDRLDNPVGALTALGSAAVDPRNLGKALRETLVNEPRVVEHILGQHGFTPPLIAALGGPGRVVKIIGQIARNPPKAIVAGIRDALHNLAHPKELGRHIINGVKRVVEATPVGPVIKLLGRLFRPRHRGPRTGVQSTQRVSEAAPVEPVPLPTERPESMERPYTRSEDDRPGI